MFAHIRAVLFDLDGTLIDSAPTWALLQTRCEPTAACPPCPWSTTAPWQALEPGHAGMRLRYAPEHPDFSAFKEEFFANYEACLTRTQVFDGVEDLIQRLRDHGLAWGWSPTSTAASPTL
jgi:phosphoglycolate phosphatase